MVGLGRNLGEEGPTGDTPGRHFLKTTCVPVHVPSLRQMQRVALKELDEVHTCWPLVHKQLLTQLCQWHGAVLYKHVHHFALRDVPVGLRAHVGEVLAIVGLIVSERWVGDAVVGCRDVSELSFAVQPLSQRCPGNILSKNACRSS
jgi:hypothetical protein